MMNAIINIFFDYPKLCTKILIFATLLCTKIVGQVGFSFSNQALTDAEKQFLQKQSNISTFLKPYIHFQFDTLLTHNIEKYSDNWLLRKWRHEPLFWVDSGSYFIAFDPVFDFYIGYPTTENELLYYRNIRGIRAWGHLTHKLYFETEVYECQARFPQYITDYIHSSNIAPGMGQARRFGKNGFDYSLASGLMAFKLNNRIYCILGTGKQFAGEGYRSILLSDNSFVYPFFRMTYQMKKITYNKTLSVTMSDTFPQTSFGLREKRLTTFSNISYPVTNFVELTLFEAYVFHYPNPYINRNLNWKYFNPLILTNLLCKTNNFNSLVGFNLRINPLNNWFIYSQLALYNIHLYCFNKNRIAYQLGTKVYNLFEINNLFIRFELNKAGQQMYKSLDNLLQYSNYNQPLAHPLGTNFLETLIQINYQYNKILINTHIIKSEYGLENVENIPITNRFVKEIQYTTPFLGDGAQTRLNYLSISLGYMVNPVSRRTFEIGYVNRSASINKKKYKLDFFYVSFKTNLLNQYFDF